MPEDLPAVLDLLEAPGQRGALATLVAVQGSSYRKPGARVIWWQDGRRAGCVSGGCVENDLLEHCRAAAADGLSRHVAYNTDDAGDPVFGFDTGCEGRLDIVVEPLGSRPHPLAALRGHWDAERHPTLEIDWRNPGQVVSRLLDASATASAETIAGVYRESPKPPHELWIWGAGDDAMTLASMARPLGWSIHILDTRRALLSTERFPGTRLTLVADCSDLPTSRRAPAVVVMSHRFRDDLDALLRLAPRKVAYVGLLGSRRRGQRLCAEAAARGAHPEFISRIRTPAGLHLGGEGPAAVALSIVSEIQSVLFGAGAVSHAFRGAPVHSEANAGDLSPRH